MADDNKPDPKSELMALVPTHCVSLPAALHIRRRTGRPKQVRLAPDADGVAYAEALGEIARRFIACDELVEATSAARDRGDLTILDKSMLELAREAAALRYVRETMMTEAKDIGAVSSKRVESLSKLASLVCERQRLGVGDACDHRSVQFQKLVDYFMTEMADAAQRTLTPEEAEAFLSRYRECVEGWEERVG